MSKIAVTEGIGARATRARDTVLLAGTATFVADIDLPHALHARVVRSPMAHAVLNGVDASDATAMPGVVGVFTAADIRDLRVPIRLAFAATEEAARATQPVLAHDRVRYVGEPVAVVLAEDPWIAEDAAELVLLDLEPLPAVTDPVAGAAPDAPVVHEALGGNVVNTVPAAFGDVEAAFAAADVIVRRTFRLARQTAAPIETRGLLAEPTADGGLTLYGAAKVKHYNRTVLADLLGLEPGRVRLVEVDVGGGFGARGELYPEDVLVPLLALRTGRPVRWIEDRAENLVAANHARAQVHELEVAAKADGTLLGFRGTHWVDQGAYIRTQGILPTLLPAGHLPGPYVWQAFSLVAHGVMTTCTPIGTYRGPGMTEATFVRERMLDIVAAEIGIDPVELRRRNLIRPEAMPFVYDLGEGAMPIVYDSGDFPAFFERLLDVGCLADERERAARTAGRERIGVGVAISVELGALGPFEEATVHVADDGSAVIRAGVGSLGQGIETALAQIAAEALGLHHERIEVRFHDTADVASGFGSYASRSAVFAGNAVAAACEVLLARAAEALGVPAGEIEARDGAAWAGGAVFRLSALGEVTGRFDKSAPSYSFGASLSVVAVDAVTGKVTPLRHVVAADVGRAINPALVEGQLAGAAMQGIAGALLEEAPYDEDGQPLAVSFADYRLPTLAEAPEIVPLVIESAVAGNPLGLKGAGEAGIVSAGAATANAVADALGAAGAHVVEVPLTPQRVAALVAP